MTNSAATIPFGERKHNNPANKQRLASPAEGLREDVERLIREIRSNCEPRALHDRTTREFRTNKFRLTAGRNNSECDVPLPQTASYAASRIRGMSSRFPC